MEEHLDEEQIIEDLQTICNAEWVQQVQDVFGFEFAKQEYHLEVKEAMQEAFHIDVLGAELLIGSYGDQMEDS